MGERKGQQFYYPPDFDPNRHGNLNRYHGTHALRERGKHASQGILTIRFEMPFNCWCLTCNNPIGMGVRYNAQKKKTGMYYSTPIYQFSMLCHLCAGEIIIETDPKNLDYVFIAGARRKEQRWDPSDNEQVHPDLGHVKRKLELDSMYRLEHGVTDKKKIDDKIPLLTQLEEKQISKRDDFLLNQMARKQFRDVKDATKLKQKQNKEFLSKFSLDGSDLTLLDESETDRKVAGLLKYSIQKDLRTTENAKKRHFEEESIFDKSKKIKPNDSSNSKSSQLKKLRDSIQKDKAARLGVGSCFSQSKSPAFNVSTRSNSSDKNCDQTKISEVNEFKPTTSSSHSGYESSSLVNYADSENSDDS